MPTQFTEALKGRLREYLSGTRRLGSKRLSQNSQSLESLRNHNKAQAN